jgi:alkaline phosphatase D
MTVPWHGAGYAVVDDGDHGSTFVERAEIYAHVRREKITGFVTVAGDRHSFWAGLAAPRLPPREFEPVGVAFVTASLSAPNAADLTEDGVRKDHPLRRLYLNSRAGETWPEPTINILLKHGVRSCLEYLNSGDMTRARSLSNPQLAPHLKFLDFEAHGYSIVRASSDALECEFVCLPRPLERSSGPDGGALLYRVRHRVPAWSAGQTPQIEQQVVEGNPQLSL